MLQAPVQAAARGPGQMGCKNIHRHKFRSYLLLLTQNRLPQTPCQAFEIEDPLVCSQSFSLKNIFVLLKAAAGRDLFFVCTHFGV